MAINVGDVAPLAIAEKSLVICHKNFICYDDPATIVNGLVDYFEQDSEALQYISEYIRLMNLLDPREKGEELLRPDYLAETKKYYPLISTLCEISEVNRIFAHKIQGKCIHGINCIDPHAAMGNIDLLTDYVISNGDVNGLKKILELYRLHGECDIADAIWENNKNIGSEQSNEGE